MNHPFSTRLPVHSPHFIFVQGGQRYSDQRFLEQLGFLGLEIHTRNRVLDGEINLAQHRTRPTFVITETQHWKMIADDWLYSLWHVASTQGFVEQVADEHEVLMFSTGDSDSAYDLRHFVDGNLVREWIVDDKFGGGDQRILVDWGKPLSAERGLQGGVLVDYLLDIAKGEWLRSVGGH